MLPVTVTVNVIYYVVGWLNLIFFKISAYNRVMGKDVYCENLFSPPSTVTLRVELWIKFFLLTLNFY